MGTAALSGSIPGGRLLPLYRSFSVDSKSDWEAVDPAALEREADGEWADRTRS